MKYLIGIIIGFVIGFYINSLMMIPAPTPLLGLAENTSSTTQSIQQISEREKNAVIFDGKKFKPSEIHVQAGQKIELINESKTVLMKLHSEENALTTARGYGELEHHTAVIMDPGEYFASVEGIPSARVKIVIFAL